jgi:putative transposase
VSKKFGREVREFVIGQLRERRSDGELSMAAIRSSAVMLECSTRSIFRWMADGVPEGSRRAFEGDEALIALYYEMRGNVVRVHEALQARSHEGEYVASRQTLDRWFRKRLTKAEREYVRIGHSAWDQEQGVTRRQAAHRNEIWEADDKQLPIYAVLKRGTRRFKPWATLFIDLYSRAIPGWVIATAQPTRAEVVAALRRAIMYDPEEGPFCGIPYVLRWDNGRNFTSEDATILGFHLGCDIRPTIPYRPQHKGTVERVNGTLARLLDALPFNADGPTGRDGEPYGPDTDPIPIQALVDEFAIAVRKYNLERPHRALGGRTPLEAWSEDNTPVRTLDQDALRYELPRKTKILMRDGISHEGVLFWAPEFHGLDKGQKVEIRYMPYDLRRVEVFVDDTWVCTAEPHDKATEEERRRFHAANQAARKQGGERMRRLSRTQRARLAPLHKDAAIEVVSPVTKAEIERAKRADRSLAANAAFSLILSEDETDGGQMGAA